MDFQFEIGEVVEDVASGEYGVVVEIVAEAEAVNGRTIRVHLCDSETDAWRSMDELREHGDDGDDWEPGQDLQD